jgi:hypothetical protein
MIAYHGDASTRPNEKTRFGGASCHLSLGANFAVQPETVPRRHRLGFRAYWHWKSRYFGCVRGLIPKSER